MQIENRVFLITGAGSGLGAAVSKMAVEAGAKVVLLDVNAEAGEAGAKAHTSLKPSPAPFRST